MKTQIAAIGLSLTIAACGSAPEVEDPYASLAEDSLLVRFEANAELPEGQCNPNVHYALRTSEEYILLNANFEVVDHNLTGSGASLVNQDDSGIAVTTIELNMFDRYPVPCSELQVKVQDLTCRTEENGDNTPCPNPVYEGTDMFASFRELPDY
ncbi:MAG: hypothetical protein HRT81_06655 [Henriciella sp.]|nr:hypothetical protein [Henriciella sp.]